MAKVRLRVDVGRGTELARLRLQWFGHWNGHGSVPLALCGEGCLMRRQALAALDRVGLAWNLRVAASNVGVVEAAAAAGVAVGPLLEAIAPAGLAADEALLREAYASPPEVVKLATELVRDAQ